MDLRGPLKKHFGYDQFRPLQEEIVRDALAGRDVFALMPTGGGKSLCFQLPALLREGLTIVVSPLISLMKDQVDALQASGIAATFLTALDGDQARARLRGLHRGEHRLLYVAPERLMLESFLEKIKQWNVTQIAIDEAHCIKSGATISGQIPRASARLHFPEATKALTATATGRVGRYPAAKLRNHAVTWRASPPNLTYRVVPKTTLRASADLYSEPARGERDCLLREQKDRRSAGGQPHGRWDQGETVSRWTGSGPTGRKPGSVPPG
jgi:ATP-dependent DNA helicase RecQ